MVWTISRVCVIALVVSVALLSAPPTGGAQGKGALPSDTLAQVGSGVITARDLVRRIELMPFPGRQTPVQAESLKALEDEDRRYHGVIGENDDGAEFAHTSRPHQDATRQNALPGQWE